MGIVMKLKDINKDQEIKIIKIAKKMRDLKVKWKYYEKRD